MALSVNTVLEHNMRIREEKRVLTSDEIEILYKASRDGRLYPLFVIALNTGMRIGDAHVIIRLKLEQTQ